MRIVANLKSKGIPVTIWNGTRAVPLEEWPASRTESPAAS